MQQNFYFYSPNFIFIAMTRENKFVIRKRVKLIYEDDLQKN